jgi:hypothetical protein
MDTILRETLKVAITPAGCILIAVGAILGAVIL